MMEWFRQRDRREQVILVLGALLASVIVAWSFVWKPLEQRASELRQDAAELSRLLADLERAAGLSAADPLEAVGSGSLLSILDQAARPLGLAANLERQRQDGPDAIYVSFRDAPFDALNAWLMALQSDYGLYVESVSGIAGSGTPGLVNGQILLRRS